MITKAGARHVLDFRKGQELFHKMGDAFSLRDASRRTADELFPPVYARVER
ncbi:hypothetical protein [Arthrobacter sp. NyZ413]|uniref:hypothetical protein n=1 Tax=Arthrobacter sp. NyZ413 TaxID=3144669 RepID=UPI002D0E9D1A|nr:hypothetical protein [Arthrobacter sp.]